MASEKKRKIKKGTASKPFMIRGDRLLLFMDIMELLRNHLRRDGEWKEREVIGYENPRQLSLHRVVAILGERFGATEAKLYDGIEALSHSRSGWIWDFRSFLRSNAVALGVLVLKVDVIISRIAVSTKDYATYPHLFEAIAHGDLTEADFKE